VVRCGAGEAAGEAVQRAVRERLAAPSDAVHALMRRRVRELWERAAGGQEGKRAGAEGSLGSEGLWRRAMEAAGRMGRMAAVNREVHRAHYNRIISDEVLALAAGEVAVGPSEGAGAWESGGSGSMGATAVSA
jgi:hypothetical protein